MTPLPNRAVGNAPLVQAFNQLRQCIQERNILESPDIRLTRTSQGVYLFCERGKGKKSRAKSEVSYPTSFSYKVVSTDVITYTPKIEFLGGVFYGYGFKLSARLLYLPEPVTPELSEGIWSITATTPTPTYPFRTHGIEVVSFLTSRNPDTSVWINGRNPYRVLFSEGTWPGATVPSGPFLLNLTAYPGKPGGGRFRIYTLPLSYQESFEWTVSGKLVSNS